MITAVDTNVLIDVFGADPRFGQCSATAVRACLLEGRLVACGVVWAEVASLFSSAAAAQSAMEQLGVQFSPLEVESALAAGDFWRDYRNRGGSRERVTADFLVGAHAWKHADRLLTRDRGFYRAYFSDLKVLDPSAGQ